MFVYIRHAGEEVRKLDVLANELFINSQRNSFTTGLLVSEVDESVIEVIQFLYFNKSAVFT